MSTSFLRTSLGIACAAAVLLGHEASAESRPRRFSDPVAEALASLVEQHGKGSVGYDPARPPVAVFDWDDTMAYNDTSELALDRALRRLELPIGDALRKLLPRTIGGRERSGPILDAFARARAGSPAAAKDFRVEMHVLYEDLGKEWGRDRQYRWFSKLFAGSTEPELAKIGEQSIAEACAEPLTTERIASDAGGREIAVQRGLRLYRPMADLVTSLHRAGWEVWVVSAGVEPLIRSFATRLGIPAERVVGVRLAAAATTNLLLPAIIDPFPYAAGKVSAIGRFIKRRPRLVAGDSSGDVPMLRYASDARLVVARDESSAAVRAARAEGWMLVTPQEMLDPAENVTNCGLGEPN